MNTEQLLKLVKDIMWHDHITEPNEIVIAVWQKLGANFTDKQLWLLRKLPAETTLRRQREVPKPTNQKLL